MAKQNVSNSAPIQPRSFQEMVKEAMSNQTYANDLRDQLQKARSAMTVGEQQAALAEIDKQFALSPDELKDMDLPPDLTTRACALCTNTRPTLFLVEFAASIGNKPKG